MEVVTMNGTYENGTYDVVVVGGGAAGLSAALVLGRARNRALVVDAGEPRNAPSSHMQGYLSRDGVSPAEFLALGREEIARYGVELVRDRVTDVTRDGDFTVVLDRGPAVRARRLIVATGLKDEMPDVPGVAERFGRDVLHCPFCHGWEVRDEPFGVLASTAMSVHQALMVSQWSKDVTLFLHRVDEAELSDQDLRRLAAAGVGVVPGEVAELVVEDDRLTGVRLADGSTHPARWSSPRRARCRGRACWSGWAPRWTRPLRGVPGRRPDRSDHGARGLGGGQRDRLRRAGGARGERRLPRGGRDRGDLRMSDLDAAVDG
ncbi:hypothetical protein SHKM778_59070 [Streptomyces sp. KM77-8]|uniref:FAD/NAD(P)-binding domain-containing protein n=1 Tax=Streptomyces haneummycinicus TaxID=3074435 RepID=A0AAT9HQQ7_9ACTN